MSEFKGFKELKLKELKLKEKKFEINGKSIVISFGWKSKRYSLSK